MVSSSGTFVNRLLMSKEHRNVLAGSRLQFWIKLANVNESFTESFTEFHLFSWNLQIIMVIGLIGHSWGHLDSSNPVYPHLAI